MVASCKSCRLPRGKFRRKVISLELSWLGSLGTGSDSHMGRERIFRDRIKMSKVQTRNKVFITIVKERRKGKYQAGGEAVGPQALH